VDAQINITKILPDNPGIPTIRKKHKNSQNNAKFFIFEMQLKEEYFIN